MKDLFLRKSLICAIMIVLAIPVFSGNPDNRNKAALPGEGLFMKSPVKRKKGKVIKPQSAKKAQKKQDAKDKKLKKDYEKFVRNNQKRSLEIQTPVVRERMKQNKKEANASYKAKKKSATARTKRGAKKYGK